MPLLSGRRGPLPQRGRHGGAPRRACGIALAGEAIGGGARPAREPFPIDGRHRKPTPVDRAAGASRAATPRPPVPPSDLPHRAGGRSRRQRRGRTPRSSGRPRPPRSQHGHADPIEVGHRARPEPREGRSAPVGRGTRRSANRHESGSESTVCPRRVSRAVTEGRLAGEAVVLARVRFLRRAARFGLQERRREPLRTGRSGIQRNRVDRGCRLPRDPPRPRVVEGEPGDTGDVGRSSVRDEPGGESHGRPTEARARGPELHPVEQRSKGGRRPLADRFDASGVLGGVSATST